MLQVSMSNTGTVLIADEHALLRDAFKMIVSRVLGPVRFLEAHDTESLFQALAQCPDIRLALVDPKIPGMCGGLRLHQIAWDYPLLPLVVVSSVISPNVVHRIAAMPSVHAFVSKCSTADELQAAIEATLQGRRVPAALSNHTVSSRRSCLTPRQEEIRQLLRQGLSNKTIAATLGISTGTVKNHITEIFKTLNTSNRMQAAQLDAES
ncbi:MAG: response regulator transcription factor [Steroidobacter sp.]